MYKMKECISIFDDYADLTDSRRYFSDEEIEQSKQTFIDDLMNGQKEHYIKTIIEQIEETKPVNGRGVYDFVLIGEYETLLKRIQLF